MKKRFNQSDIDDLKKYVNLNFDTDRYANTDDYNTDGYIEVFKQQLFTYLHGLGYNIKAVNVKNKVRDIIKWYLDYLNK
jgi:hypothetical protein